MFCATIGQLISILHSCSNSLQLYYLFLDVTVFLVSFLQLKRKAFQMFRGVLILSLLLGEYEANLF